MDGESILSCSELSIGFYLFVLMSECILVTVSTVMVALVWADANPENEAVVGRIGVLENTLRYGTRYKVCVHRAPPSTDFNLQQQPSDLLTWALEFPNLLMAGVWCQAVSARPTIHTGSMYRLAFVIIATPVTCTVVDTTS